MWLAYLLAVLTAFGLTPCRLESGYAGYYAHGVMRDVVLMRQSGNTAMPLPRELPEVYGFIATDDCNEVGQLACVYHHSEGWLCPYLIVDCCNELEGHCQRMKDLNIVADVGYNTAARWGVLGHGGTGEAGIKIGVVKWGSR